MPGLTITDVLAVPATGGFFADDQAAIKGGAPRDGLAYRGPAVTPGADAIRAPAEAVSVLLVLSDGHVAHGDCVSVQYSGVGGREPRLRAQALAAVIAGAVAPELRGTAVDGFRAAARRLDRLAAAIDDVGTAATYGLSQALLDAAAHGAGVTMAEHVRAEWGLDGPLRRIPVYAQSGEERRVNVDKMILKGVDALPHGLINEPSLVGAGGADLIAYVRWVRERVQQLRPSAAYAPVLHFDVYGLLGEVARGDLEAVADIVCAMGAEAAPLALRVEHPVDAGSRDGQIAAMAQLRRILAARGAGVQLVADEWANSAADVRAFTRAGAADVIQVKAPDLGSLHHAVEAILDCRRHGVTALLGGSCTETERAAQVSVHVALGAGADQMLAKPGMGVDEGLSIVRNEMERTLALAAVAAAETAAPG
ncbi:methylaspartate ammonia-lyase [Baekduia soli]|uniref:methylaspartate ammonia-lyase n=1 Tax=Baekduia soli TaxID=496014 RepID=A0A5B8TZK8_9ACTN|nr:methylaspartate ammonia-lyase [Baekduia soli]QEC46155.1 methylaspartate ammonia-lyase [Baekduia soli]